MIPLRVLHVTSPEAIDASLAMAQLVRWQTAEGHACAVAAPEHLLDSLPVSGCDVLPYRTGLMAWWRGARLDFAQRLARWTPDLIHVHDPLQVEAVLDVARRLGLMMVAAVQGAEDPWRCRALRDTRVAWVLAQTESQRVHCLSRLRLPRDRVTVLPPGLRLPSEQLPVAADESLDVGFAGPYGRDDGLDDLLVALAQLHQDTGAVRGHALVRSPAERQRVTQAIERHGVGAWVKLVDELAVFLATIEVFACPSRGDRAAWTMIAAMAIGRPVVATAVGPRPELVREGSTALLCPPRRPAALAAALGALRSSSERRRLGDAGRAWAQERFDIDLVGQATVELYRAAIGGEASPSAAGEVSSIFRRVSQTRTRL